MSNEMRYRTDTKTISVAVDSGTVIEIGDMVYLDTDDVKPVSTSALWSSDLDGTQQALKPIFLGIALSASASGETDPVLVCVDGVFEMDASSDSYELGTLVAPAKDSGSNLLDQTVEDAQDIAGAIGIVYKKTGTATRVMVRFISQKMTGITIGAEINAA